MRVLIAGAGIAGPTLAYWLAHHGAEVTLVEKAPKLRTGGYIIDFWGAGFEIADRMGLLPEIREKGYQVKEVRVVNRSGKKIAAMPVDAVGRVTGGRFTSLPRSNLAALIFESIQGRLQTRFGDSVAHVEQDEKRVRVGLESGEELEADLVVGADGLHSRVREIIFGKEEKFERYLGYKVAAFEADGYRPRDELVYVMYTQVGQQVTRFTLRGDRTMFLFIFADGNAECPANLQEQKEELRKRFGNSGWECPQILDAMDRSSELYFDRVSQIRMEGEPGLWSRGRVTLLGDAASCVSFLAGQGSSLAMTGAYLLAAELTRTKPNYAEAFARYQERFGPFVAAKQKAALRLAEAFVPKSNFSMLLRNQVFNLMKFHWIADWAIGRDLVDRITLPAYN